MRKVPRTMRIFFVSFLLSFANAEGLQPRYYAPLGMEDGRILDADLTASSSVYPDHVGPQQARIRNESKDGAWCPNGTVASELHEWLQIELHLVHRIAAIEIQGRDDHGRGKEFAEFYVVDYYRRKLGAWRRYKTNDTIFLLTGNNDTITTTKTILEYPIMASKLRIYPYNTLGRTTCLRVEIFGCLLLDGILSYSMPQGDKNGSYGDFYDTSYDGKQDGRQLNGGVGKLIDGNIASDDWVGWCNNTFALNEPVEIVFEFDQVRQYQAVHLYFSKQLQTFANVSVYFSIDGHTFTGNPLSYITEDTDWPSIWKITGKLCENKARFIKLQLHFDNQWILISEVKFQSFPAENSSALIENNCKYTSIETSSKFTMSKIIIIFVTIGVLLVILIITGIIKLCKVLNNYHSTPTTDTLLLEQNISRRRVQDNQGNIYPLSD